MDVDYNPVASRTGGATRMIKKNATLAILCCHNYKPIFTPEQCKMIIDAGHQCAPEQAKVGVVKKVSTIPRNE